CRLPLLCRLRGGRRPALPHTVYRRGSSADRIRLWAQRSRGAGSTRSNHERPRGYAGWAGSEDPVRESPEILRNLTMQGCRLFPFGKRRIKQDFFADVIKKIRIFLFSIVIFLAVITVQPPPFRPKRDLCTSFIPASTRTT